MIKKLNLLKTIALCLSIFANCSGIKLIDGLINDLHIKVKTNSGDYIEPTIEKIEIIAENTTQNKTQRKIQSFCSNHRLCEELGKELEDFSGELEDFSEELGDTIGNISIRRQIRSFSLDSKQRMQKQIENFSLNQESTELTEKLRREELYIESIGSDRTNTDGYSTSDWDADIEEITTPTAQLITFDLELINSDIFIIEIYSKLKREFSIICYKNQLQESIPYYVLTLTTNINQRNLEQNLRRYNFRLDGKIDPLSNEIINQVELKAPRRSFSVTRINRFED